MSRRKFKRKMIKELGVEKFSDQIKRKLKDASSRRICADTAPSRSNEEA
jgi:hypothetical protein